VNSGTVVGDMSKAHRLGSIPWIDNDLRGIGRID
jgi:hypothetical protein